MGIGMEMDALSVTLMTGAVMWLLAVVFLLCMFGIVQACIRRDGE
jgi:hypothetical protein